MRATDIKKGVLALAVLCCLPLPAQAASTVQVLPLGQVRDEAAIFLMSSIKKLSQLSGFRCDFRQVITYFDGGEQPYSGNLAVRRPGHFRWQYKRPYEQLYIGDGRLVWHYEPDLMQAEQLDNLESVDPLVMQLLDGRLTADDIRLLQHQDDRKGGVRRFQVRVGEAPELWLDFRKDGTLVAIERTDALSNRNKVSLSACSYIAPDENLFSFSPPEGVEVLDLRSGSKSN
jgi:outer membrane lipoprotein carrier protein